MPREASLTVPARSPARQPRNGPPSRRPAPPVTAGERRQSQPPACRPPVTAGESRQSPPPTLRPLSPPGSVTKHPALRSRARPTLVETLLCPALSFPAKASRGGGRAQQSRAPGAVRQATGPAAPAIRRTRDSGSLQTTCVGRGERPGSGRTRERGRANGAHALHSGLALRTCSLNLAPPPLPCPWQPGGWEAGMPGRGERESAGAGAEGRGQAAYACARARARAGPTCTSSDAPPSQALLAGVVMGSGPVAGWVRARYLVYFQYVGTDFKYVLRTSHTHARDSRATRRAGEGDLRPLTCVLLCPQRGRGCQGRPASRRGPELPGGKSRRRMKGEAGTGQGKPSLGPGLRPLCPPRPRRLVPVGGCRAAQLGRAGQVYHFQPHGRRGPRAGQRGSLGRAAPLGLAALLSRGPGRSPQRSPEAPGHPVSATLVSLDWPTAGGGQRSERTLCLHRTGALGEMSRCHLGG